MDLCPSLAACRAASLHMLAISAPAARQQVACVFHGVHPFSQIPSLLIKESVNTAESWGELSQALGIDISWLAQLQALQMLLKDFFPFLRGEGRQKDDRTVGAAKRSFPHTSTFTTGQAPAFTCRVGRSIKMCLSSLPGLIRALSRMSALFVEARTMTWSVVPIPEGKRVQASSSRTNTKGHNAASRIQSGFSHRPSQPAAG